jgi:hypothetical protein
MMNKRIFTVEVIVEYSELSPGVMKLPAQHIIALINAALSEDVSFRRHVVQVIGSETE